MPRVYSADHTAHIRDRLKGQALHAAAGLIAAMLVAGSFAIFLSGVGDVHHVRTVAVWGLLIVVGLTSVLGRVLTCLEYLVYRRRRADLDAVGA